MRDMLAQLNRRTKRFSKSIEMLSCLADVVTNNLIFFKDNNASQNTARLDSFNLMPSTKLMEDLNQDYENMAMMIFRRCSRF